jgi:hypothetical protein
MNDLSKGTVKQESVAWATSSGLLVSAVASLALGFVGAWPVLAMASTTPQDASSVAPRASASTPAGAERSRRSTKLLCSRLQRALDSSPSSTEMLSMSVPTEDGGGRSTLYQGVDLDGDGRADTLLQGCGSPSEGSCVLYVTTSAGHRYEFDGRPFYVGVFERQYYIIEGNSYPRKPRQRDRNIYLLTESSAKRVCKSI